MEKAAAPHCGSIANRQKLASFLEPAAGGMYRRITWWQDKTTGQRYTESVYVKRAQNVENGK